MYAVVAPVADWGVNGIRPFIWSRFWFHSRTNFNGIMFPPTAENPWPATALQYAWGY